LNSCRERKAWAGRSSAYAKKAIELPSMIALVVLLVRALVALVAHS
jgi:hypothetical protein